MTRSHLNEIVVRSWLRELSGQDHPRRGPSARGVAWGDMATTPRRQRPPKVEGWISQLDGGRVEIFLKAERFDGAPDYKIRSSGPEAQMMELVDTFEGWTGLRVEIPRIQRVRRGPKPIEGQTTLLMGERPGGVESDSGELSSDATVGADG